MLDDLEKVLADTPKSIREHRDRAILAVAWAAGLRRSEVVGLDCDEAETAPGFVRFTSQGMEIVLNRSKTDQEGAGRTIAIPLRRDGRKCPVRLLQKWMQVAKLRSGPLFRPIDLNSGKLGRARLKAGSVARIVKKAAKRLGFDPRFYAGHSMRAGFVSSVAAAGASVPAIQATTGHKQVTTLFGYVRLVRLYQESALHAIPGW
ncbi:site-specific integrase [Telmatospirillum siberiense]|uniref:site-specific integrase n=1 Tax=Telmatospirillum siberiense TaxID=382514 RepID=UPI0013040802|nr:site-specific integrase [Telmatospirillum siberiense]